MHRLQGMRTRIAEVAGELLDAVADKSEFDFLQEAAFPLPVTVLSKLLGMPLADKDRFGQLCADLNQASPEQMEQLGDELAGLIMQWVDLRRAEPGDNQLTELVKVHDNEGQLSLEELGAMVFQVMSAGTGPTSHLISPGVLALVQHPEQLAMVRADRSLVSAAIDEFARYETTVHLTMPSVAAEPLEIEGVRIAENDFVMVSTGAANHDPAYRTDPDSFDIRGKTAGHLGYGHGIHRCLGASLGSIQAEVVLSVLPDRYERIELAVAPQETAHKAFPARVLEGLPLRVG